MALKRKRSDLVDSPYSTSSSATAGPSRDPSSSPVPEVCKLENVPQWSHIKPSPESASSHLNSRTRKRYRDNRPNEEIVYANTYDLLYAAARSPPPIAHKLSDPAAPVRPPPPQRQPSLHNFWTISSPPPPTMQVENTPASINVPACEDCERPLPLGFPDLSMGGMDVDSSDGWESACRTCGKRVCDMCAVVQTGIGRDCLQCMTTQNKWVVGIGWVP